MDLQWIAAFLSLGALVGFMAGLLGVGGGGIMVPVLTTLFLWQDVPAGRAVHLALGTSMASIVVTSFASLRAHHARGAVVWSIVRTMSAGILAGTFAATFLAVRARSLHLAVFFSLFMAFIAVQMFLNRQPPAGRKPVGRGGLLLGGSVIGAISALVSIGGGALTVPFLLWQNIDMKKAIGTSAAIGFPISVAGTAGYVVNGWAASAGGDGRHGLVYLPAVLLISAASYLTVPHGAKVAHRLPVAALRRVFAVLLVLLSLKMLTSVL